MSLVQTRRDTAMTAPALRDAGRPLDAATRSSFESGFNRDLSRVRVHDDAHAHDGARALDARAYAAGDHIVFGEGEYRPETAQGRALIAHEIAHTVQQSALAMKTDGPLPAGADARLEAEADRAAADVLSGRAAPALSRAAQPAVLRAGKEAAVTPAPAGTAPVSARPANIAEGFSIDSAAPPVPGANEVTIWLDYFKLPRPKGAGQWVQAAYDEATTGKRLGTILMISGSNYASWKEDSKTDEYRTAWLRRHGFTSLAHMAGAITEASTSKTKPVAVHGDVKALLPTLGQGLSVIKCDIDHIVEKQMGGTSQPSNLQILTSTVNQASGREAYAALKEHARRFIAHSKDWSNVQRIAMRIREAKVDLEPHDASTKLEDLLRTTPNLGNAKLAAGEDHKALYLAAGNVGETLQVKEKGETEMDETGVRIVPGVKLDRYHRIGGKAGTDRVTGELDHRAMDKSKSKNSGIHFEALLPKGKPPQAAAPDAAGSAPAPSQSTYRPVAPGTELRDLKLDKKRFTLLEFNYPYLSPGVIKTIDLDGKGGLTGTGTITPSVQFLGKLDFAFGPNELRLVKKLDANALNASAMMQRLKSGFRFTESSFDLDLLNFVPSGSMSFTMGPAAKPLLNGTIKATVEGGALVATGKLTPAEIPGISAAEGTISYSSRTGWAGQVSATSTTLPGASKVDVVIGVREGPNGIDFFGDGGITTKVRDSVLSLRAGWKGGAVIYRGGVTVPHPLPLVDAVRIDGRYENRTLQLSGIVNGFTWQNRFQGDLFVNYVQKDGEEGRFSGTVNAHTIGDTSKMDGQITLSLHENGRVSGIGAMSYQVTKDIRPRLGVELIADPKYRVRLFGEVNIATIPLTGEWPKKGGERRDIIKGLGIKVPIQTPVPGLTAYFMAKGSFGVTYGIGPLALNAVKFNGELFPLEDDPKIKASLSGRLSAPGFAGVYGSFGARLGAEVLAGALGLNGGIDVTPSLTLKMDAGVGVNATYSAEQGFAFSTEAAVKTALIAQIAFDLKASVYGAYGAIEYTWTHPLNDPKPRQIGPEFKVTLGRLSYSKEQGIVWPSLDQIDYSPKDFDPQSIIRDLLAETEPKKV